MLKVVLFLDDSRTISEASGQKHIGGRGGKGYVIGGGYLQSLLTESSCIGQGS